MASNPVNPINVAPPPPPAPPAPVKKVSFWKKFESEVIKIIGFTATHVQPIAQEAGVVASIIEPQLAPEISMAENIVSKIAQQAMAIQSGFAVVGQAGNGPAKGQAVVQAVSNDIDTWIQNSFPGAKKASELKKAGLVQAVYDLIDDVDPELAMATPSAVATASAVKAAVASMPGSHS